MEFTEFIGPIYRPVRTINEIPIVTSNVPKGYMFIVPARRYDETYDEWMSRCYLIKNIKIDVDENC